MENLIITFTANPFVKCVFGLIKKKSWLYENEFYSLRVWLISCSTTYVKNLLGIKLNNEQVVKNSINKSVTNIGWMTRFII